MEMRERVQHSSYKLCLSLGLNYICATKAKKKIEQRFLVTAHRRGDRVQNLRLARLIICSDSNNNKTNILWWNIKESQVSATYHPQYPEYNKKLLDVLDIGKSDPF